MVSRRVTIAATGALSEADSFIYDTQGRIVEYRSSDSLSEKVKSIRYTYAATGNDVSAEVYFGDTLAAQLICSRNEEQVVTRIQGTVKLPYLYLCDIHYSYTSTDIRQMLSKKEIKSYKDLSGSVYLIDSTVTDYEYKDWNLVLVSKRNSLQRSTTRYAINPGTEPDYAGVYIDSYLPGLVFGKPGWKLPAAICPGFPVLNNILTERAYNTAAGTQYVFNTQGYVVKMTAGPYTDAFIYSCK
ncbi:MAG: hypothetical protein V4543_13305 [Bacteroidota bacterium]